MCLSIISDIYFFIIYICLLPYSSFLKSEFRQVISDGVIFKSHIGSSSFFKVFSGILRNSAAFLYSSENISTISTVPSICRDFNPPKEAFVSNTAAETCLFSLNALNLSPPSVNIQIVSSCQLYSKGVQRTKSPAAVASARIL